MEKCRLIFAGGRLIRGSAEVLLGKEEIKISILIRKTRRKDDKNRASRKIVIKKVFEKINQVNKKMSHF